MGKIFSFRAFRKGKGDFPVSPCLIHLSSSYHCLLLTKLLVNIDRNFLAFPWSTKLRIVAVRTDKGSVSLALMLEKVITLETEREEFLFQENGVV